MLKSTLAHLKFAACSPKTYEILIVDDGSSDDTSGLALQISKENPIEDIRVVTLHKNLGKGGAVRHGMMHGRGKRLLMVDADGASRFEDLELLWKAMDTLETESSPAAIALGSRAHLVKSEAVVKACFPNCSRLFLSNQGTPSVAVSLAQCSYVRPSYNPTNCRSRPHTRHAMRLQVVLSSRRSAHIPLPAPLYMDLRRRGSSAGETAACPRCRGTYRVARGVWKQVERRHRLTTDAEGPAHLAGEHHLRQMVRASTVDAMMDGCTICSYADF